jgi:UDP-2,3-diacylglucosamine pyrophosphatase LpxH
MKIYCASDFHIGYEHANYSKMKEFFELVKENADELILCGDILDLWRCPIEKIRNTEPLKSTYEALLSTALEVPTTIIWGNHDYQLWKKVRIPIRVTDHFVSNNIYYCHGWRFDLKQRAGQWLYRGLVNQFPYLYQKFFKHPFEIKTEVERYKLLSRMTHQIARDFIETNKVDYLIMGHTHDPLEDDKLFDCGDMMDSLSYVIVDNGKPKLEKMHRENK